MKDRLYCTFVVMAFPVPPPPLPLIESRHLLPSTIRTTWEWVCLNNQQPINGSDTPVDDEHTCTLKMLCQQNIEK